MKLPWSRKMPAQPPVLGASQPQPVLQAGTLLSIPIQDGELSVLITEPRSPVFGDPTYDQVRRATLSIDCGVVQVVEPNLYVLDSDLDELDICLQDLEERRESTWLATSGRSPYLHFRPVPDDPEEWEVVFHDAPATGAEVRAYMNLNWVAHCRKLLDDLRIVEAAA